MNSLIEKGIISEKVCGSNFSYILNDRSTFLSIEYKVLQNQTDGGFVKCMKMYYNGRIQLFYITRALKPFAKILPSLDSEGFWTITTNLLSNVVDVMHNGFLSCQNIDISLEHIYVDPATYKVSLVYIPVSHKLYADNSSFENALRTGLIKLISGISAISTPRTMQLATDLANGTLSLEDVLHRMKGGKQISNTANTPVPTQNPTSEKIAKIIAIDAPIKLEYPIDKDEFVMGKNTAVADGIIGYNPMVSRVHCKVNRRDGQYFITDLQSANGTFVNKVKLQPNQPYPIKHGDMIRLANSDFQMSIL